MWPGVLGLPGILPCGDGLGTAAPCPAPAPRLRPLSTFGLVSCGSLQRVLPGGRPGPLTRFPIPGALVRAVGLPHPPHRGPSGVATRRAHPRPFHVALTWSSEFPSSSLRSVSTGRVHVCAGGHVMSTAVCREEKVCAHLWGIFSHRF